MLGSALKDILKDAAVLQLSLCLKKVSLQVSRLC